MSKIKLNIGTRLFRKLTVISCYVYIVFGYSTVVEAKSFMELYHEGALPKLGADCFISNLCWAWISILVLLFSVFVLCRKHNLL
ncbi:MAG: hypothetical protein ACK58Q_14035 [Chitinophagales bacterium]